MKRALPLAFAVLVPMCAQAQFTSGSVDGIVLDSASRKPVGRLGAAIPNAGYNVYRNNVDSSGRFHYVSVPVGDRVSLDVYCARDEPLRSRVIARGSIPVRPRQGTTVEILVNYAACFAPIATTQRIRGYGYYSLSSSGSGTFYPCNSEPLHTLLSEWIAPASMTFARSAYRTPDAPVRAAGKPADLRAFVQFAGMLRGPGIYGGALHAPYAIIADSLFLVDSTLRIGCPKSEPAPSLHPGTISVLGFTNWRKVDEPTPWMAAPRDSSKDVPPSTLANHGNVESYLVDATGHPVAGAHITLDPAGPSAVTDSTGRFLLRDVPYGRYSLHFNRFGYRPDFTRFTLSANATPLMTYLTPQRVFADPAAESDSARYANTPGAYARVRLKVGITVFGERLRAPKDSTRRPAFDPLDPRLIRLLANAKDCGRPAYLVDGFLTMPAQAAATGEFRLSDFASIADVDLVQVVASKSVLDPHASDDRSLLRALPGTSCRPLVMIWTRYFRSVD